MRVLIAVPDLGSGVQLEEGLTQAGFEAKWDGAQADGPTGTGDPEVVVIDADHVGKKLVQVADAWRTHPAVPGVVAIGASQAARDLAPTAHVMLLSPSASMPTIANAVKETAKLRLSSGLHWPVLRAALKLPSATNEPSAWRVTLLHARNVDVEIPRTALRWHAPHYATTTPLIEKVRDEAGLSSVELELCALADGTRTVKTLVSAGKGDPAAAARLLWALASIGAIDLTPEVRDVGTPARRALWEMRMHLRARKEWLARATFYDVLEITMLAEYDDIEQAYQLVGRRYSPQALQRLDLSDLAPLVQPIWEQIEKARRTLVDDVMRGRYGDWMRENEGRIESIWTIGTDSIETAAEAFRRGQASLSAGNAAKAMGEFAMACRHHPGHPDYEANLSWARFRVQLAAGKDQAETAKVERANIEQWLAGRKPWPRALVALALLCAAMGDADAARWHLHIALQVDPNVPAAAQLAQRLGLRR